MAGSLGGLYFEIGARTGNLKKGIAQAQNSLNQLDKTGKKLSKSLDSIFDKAAYEISKSSGKSFNSVRKNLLELSMHYKQQAYSCSSAIEKAFNSMGKSSDKETARMLKNVQKLSDAYDIEKQKLKGLGFTDDQMKTYKGTTLPTKFNLHNLGIPTDPEYNFKFKRRLHNLGIPTENLYKESMQAYQMKSMHENYHASMQDVLNRTGDEGKTSLFTEIFGNTQIGRNISNTSNRLIELSKVAGESGGKLGSVGSTLGKVGAAASKAGPYIAAIVMALQAAIEVAKPFIKIYIKILTSVVKTTGSIALKIGKTLVNGLISPLKKGFDRLINPFGKTYGDKLGMLIGGGLVAGISYKLKNFVKDVISGGGEFEQMVQGTQILFADTRVATETDAINAASDKMRQNALMAYKNVGMSATDYMSQASSYATRILSELGGDANKAADVINTAMQDMSDNWHLLGGDFQMIQNAYMGLLRGNYRMFDNLKLGYGQTKAEVQRLLNDAEKLSGVHYDIDNLSDIMLAIHEIQEATGMTGTTAREALTTWAGATNMLRNAWQNFKDTVGQGLIYILRPVLSMIAKISDALVAAGMRFMAWAQKITGIKDMVVGKKSDKEYSSAATGIGGINDALDGTGGSAGKAKKAIKDLKRELMGFDQINKLTGEKGTTSSGTGTSGSGSGIDLDDLVDQSWMNRMVESAGEDIETIYEEKIKEAWENADFTMVGWIVARKIAEALEKINWDKIKEACGKIGASVATFLNGIFMNGRLWIDVGNSFAEAINSIVNAGYEFVSNFYWTEFGEALALGINAAVFKIDTAKIGKLISERIKGGLDFAASLIGNIDFKQIGDKIATALNNIDFYGTDGEEGIIAKAGNLGIKIAEKLNDVFGNATLWRRAGESFGGALNTIINYGYEFVTNFHWETLGASISSFLYNTFKDLDGYKLGQTLGGLFEGILTTIKTVLEDKELWDQINKTVDDALLSMNIPQLIADAFEVTNEVIGKILEIGKKIGKQIFLGAAEYMIKEHPIWSELLGLNKPYILNAIEDNKKQITVEFIGKDGKDFSKFTQDYLSLNDKPVTVTGKGIVQNTLSSVQNTVKVINDKTATVTGEGNTTTSLTSTSNTIKNTPKKKDSIIKADATSTKKFDSTTKTVTNIPKKKDSKVTFSVGAVASWAYTNMRTQINKFKKAHPHLGKMLPNLPALAQGGFVKANTPQLAVIGDNRREGEIVAPESKLAAMAQAAAGAGNDETNMLLRQLISLVASMNLNVELDGEAIKNNTVRRINNHTRSTGQLEILI